MIRKYKTPLILLALLALSFLLSFPDVRYDQLLTDEDSWIENFSALAFLAAAILFFMCFWKSKGFGNRIGNWQTKRNLIFLGLGLLFFVAFGEEISWGQRIFGWDTPENWKEANYQNETNIHNLDFFKFKDETDDSIWSQLLVLNAGRLFFYFWFSFMVLLPLLSHLFTSFRKLVQKINIPVPPIWIGLLMIANLTLSKVYKVFTSSQAGDFSGSIDEILEGNYALLIAVMAFWFFNSMKKQGAKINSLANLERPSKAG